MCGFACIFEKKHILKDRDFLVMISKMLDSLVHRGPDDQRIYSDTKNGLHIGFCRLSMVDVNLSIQPFWDSDRKTAVIFNGEIYNYKALREEMAETSFTTSGEAELLLKLYKKIGESFVKKLDGMFAICIIDLLEERVFVARDKHGIKPLYYYENDSAYIIASELKAIRAVYPLKVNKTAVEMYFSYRFIPAPFTIYEKVYKLKAGEQVSFFKDGTIKKQSYSRYNLDLSQRCFNVNECRDILTRNIVSTFEHGEMPIGLFLSGGIDSGIIATVLNNRFRNEGYVFHLEYPSDGRDIPEERALLPMISQLRIASERILFEDSVLNNMKKIVHSLDEPFYSTVSASTYALSLNARKTVKGVLTGDGSDELIYGYNYLRNAINQEDPYKAYLDGIGWLKYIDYRSLLESYSLSRDDISHIIFSDCIVKSNFLETFRRVEVFKRLPDYHLMRVDRMTMAFGLEARLPYLRSECVEMFLNIKGEFFIAEKAKSPLKEAFSSLLPSVLLNTTKQPFYAPVKRWVEKTLQTDIKNTFNDKRIMELLGLNYKSVNKILYTYDGSYAAVSNIWGIYLLLKWGQIELDKEL